MRADEYLSRIDRLDARIFDLLTEKQRLMEMATRLSPDMTGLPHVSGVSDRVGSAADTAGGCRNGWNNLHRLAPSTGSSQERRHVEVAEGCRTYRHLDACW